MERIGPSVYPWGVERRSLIQLILVTPILALLERLGLRKREPAIIAGTDEYVDFGPVQDWDWDDTKPFSMSIWSKHTPEGIKVLGGAWGTQGDDGKWHTHTWRS